MSNTDPFVMRSIYFSYVLAVAFASLCPNLQSPYSQPLFGVDHVDRPHLLEPTVAVGARHDPLSIFVALTSAIALEDLLLQPAVVKPIDETDVKDAFTNRLVDVIPADVHALHGFSGVSIDDLIVASGRQPSGDRSSRPLGVLGPLYKPVLYTTAHTINSISALITNASSLSQQVEAAGLSVSARSLALLALRNATVAEVVGSTVHIIKSDFSLAADLLCTDTDPITGAVSVYTPANYTLEGLSIGDSIFSEYLQAEGAAQPSHTSILHSLGLSMGCTASFDNVTHMDALVEAWVNEDTPFIVLGWSTWLLAAELNLLSFALPDYDPLLLYTARNSDFSQFESIRKRGSLWFQDAFHSSAVSLLEKLRFPSAEQLMAYVRAGKTGILSERINATYTRDTPLAALDITSRPDLLACAAALPDVCTPQLMQAACVWVESQQQQLLQWAARTRVAFITPDTGITTGMFTLRVIGEGFGFAPPLLLSIAIGEHVCLQSKWINDKILECVAPPGSGVNLPVRVLLGKQSFLLQQAFSYAAATVRAITSKGVDGSQFAGTSVVITGNNFYPSDELACKFSGGYHGDAIVTATFVDFETITCVPPTTFDGLLTVSVTNDGLRWSSGFSKNAEQVRFPSNSSMPPLDSGPNFAPKTVSIVFLNADVFGATVMKYHEQVANETVANLRAAGYLRYTNVTVVSYTTTLPVAAAPDQSDAGAAQLSAQFYADQVALYNRIRAAHPDLIGIVGGYQSIVTIPVVDAVHNASSVWKPVVTVSYGSSDPSLSSISTYPHFMRVVPPDDQQGDTLAQLLINLQPEVTRSGAILPNVTAPNVYAVVATDSTVSVAAYEAFRARLLAQGGVVDRIGVVRVRDSAVTISGKLNTAQIFAYPPLTRILAVFAPSDTISRIVQASQSFGLTGTGPNSRLWLGCDSFADAADIYPSILGTTAALALRPAVKAFAANATYETATAAFIADSIVGLLLPFHTLVKRNKNASLEAYPAEQLSRMARSTAFPDAATLFRSFLGTSNDPRQSIFDVVNTLALASSGLNPFVPASDVRRTVGSISPLSTPIFDANYRLVLNGGPLLPAVIPANITVLMPWPVTSPVLQMGMSGYQQQLTYSAAWTNTTEVRTGGRVVHVVQGMYPLYRGIPIELVNQTIDSVLLGSVPETFVTTPLPTLLIDPDDPPSPVGDQFSLYHTSSGLLAALESLVERVNDDDGESAALRGARVSLVLVPYAITTTQGVAAHSQLQPALHEAIRTLHVNNTPNVVGILGMHSNDGTLALLDAVKSYPDATLSKLPVVSFGARSKSLSSAALYPNFARSVPPEYVEAAAIVDLCRRYAWRSVAVLYSGLDDPVFDGSMAGAGPDLYNAFITEAAAHQIHILAAVNVSKYMSFVSTPQFPVPQSSATGATPSSFASEREAGLLQEMLKVRQSGARVIIVLSRGRSMCAVVRAAWAAKLFNGSPDMPVNTVDLPPDDYTASKTRVSNLRDNKDLVSSIPTVDLLGSTATVAEKIAELSTNTSISQNPDGMYELPLPVQDAYTWVFGSSLSQRRAPAVCLSQLSPDPWATYVAVVKGEEQQFGRNRVLEPDGNIRRTFFDGYDLLGGLQVTSAHLYGALGVEPSGGEVHETARMAEDILLRNTQSVGPHTSMLVTTAMRDAAQALGHSFTASDFFQRVVNDRATFQTANLETLLTPSASIFTFDGKPQLAATDRTLMGSPAQYLLDSHVYHARNALQMLLVATAGALRDDKNVSDPSVVMDYIRGRVPRAGPIQHTSLLKDRDVITISRNQNDPQTRVFDIVNRQGAGSNVTVRVGTLLDRGYVRFAGCPKGSEPDGEFDCRPCPVNTYKTTSGSEACTSCPLAGTTQSRMITNGAAGAASLEECLCPIGFYVKPISSQEDRGSACVACTSAMQCGAVHMQLQQVRTSSTFWRGSTTTDGFIPCVKSGRCLGGNLTTLQPLTRSFEAAYMNTTGCVAGSEGPLCGVCAAGYGEDPQTGTCALCPPFGDVVVSIMFACGVAILLVCILAGMQVTVTPSYVSWRRTNNTKLLLNYLQINAVLLALNLNWPPAVKRYFNISQLSASVNLSWISWECLLSTDTWPISMQVFTLYMAAPFGLILLSTIALFIIRRCVMRCCTKCLNGNSVSSVADKSLRITRADMSSFAGSPSLHFTTMPELTKRGGAAPAQTSRFSQTFRSVDMHAKASDALAKPSEIEERGSVVKTRRASVGTGIHSAQHRSATLEGEDDDAEVFADKQTNTEKWFTEKCAFCTARKPGNQAVKTQKPPSPTVDIFWAVVTISLFLLYPNLLRRVLEMLTCVNVGETAYIPHDVAANGTVQSSMLQTSTSEYMRYDLSVRCDSSLYTSFRPLGYLFAFVYIIGIPAFFLMIIVCGQNALHIGHGRIRLGGADYEEVLDKLLKVASWYKLDPSKLKSFGDSRAGIDYRLRRVFDFIHSPAKDTLDAEEMRPRVNFQPQNPDLGDGAESVMTSGLAKSNKSRKSADTPRTTEKPTGRRASVVIGPLGQAFEEHQVKVEERDIISEDVRDLSFRPPIRPTSRDDFLTSSNTVQHNLTRARLLEAVFEEACIVARNNGDILSISEVSISSGCCQRNASIPLLDAYNQEFGPLHGTVSREAIYLNPYSLEEPSQVTDDMVGVVPSDTQSENEMEADGEEAEQEEHAEEQEEEEALDQSEAAEEEQEEAAAVEAETAAFEEYAGEGIRPPGALAPAHMDALETRSRETNAGRLNTDFLLAASLVMAARKLRNVSTMQRRFGWLFVDYRPSAVGYEFWNTAKKAALVGAAVVFADRTGMLQCIICILLLLLFLLNHQYVQPYVDIALLKNSPHPLSSAEELLDPDTTLRSGANPDMPALSTIDREKSPVSLGYLGPLQRAVMRLRAIIALTVFDESDPMRSMAMLPDAPFNVYEPSLDDHKQATRVRFTEANQAQGKHAPQLELQHLTREDVMLANPRLLRPWHFACCSERAKRLSRSRTTCVCACPWWARLVSMIPEKLTTSWLDRLALAVHLLCLILLYIYEAQEAAVAVTDQTARSSTILSWVLMLNGGFTWILATVIAVDAWKEWQVALSVILERVGCGNDSKSKSNRRKYESRAAPDAAMLNYRARLIRMQHKEAAAALDARLKGFHQQ